jgi:hypothetical protein
MMRSNHDVKPAKGLCPCYGYIGPGYRIRISRRDYKEQGPLSQAPPGSKGYLMVFELILTVLWSVQKEKDSRLCMVFRIGNT